MNLLADVFVDLPCDIIRLIASQFISYKKLAGLIFALTPIQRMTVINKYQSLLNLFREELHSFAMYNSILKSQPFEIKARNQEEHITILEAFSEKNSEDGNLIIRHNFERGNMPFDKSIILARHLINLIITEKLTWEAFLKHPYYLLNEKLILVKIAIAVINHMPTLENLMRAVLNHLNFKDSRQLFKELLYNFAIEGSHYIVRKFLNRQLTTEQKLSYISAALENVIPNPALILFLQQNEPGLLMQYFPHIVSYERAIKQNVTLYPSEDENRNDAEEIIDYPNVQFQSGGYADDGGENFNYEDEQIFGDEQNKPLRFFDLVRLPWDDETNEMLNLFNHLVFWSHIWSDPFGEFADRYYAKFASVSGMGLKVKAVLKKVIIAHASSSTEITNPVLQQLLEGFRIFMADVKVDYPAKIEAFLIISELAHELKFEFDNKDMVYLCARILETRGHSVSWHIIRVSLLMTSPLLHPFGYRYVNQMKDAVDDLLDVKMVSDGKIKGEFYYGDCPMVLFEYFQAIRFLHSWQNANIPRLVQKLVDVIPVLSPEGCYNIWNDYKDLGRDITEEFYCLFDINSRADNLFSKTMDDKIGVNQAVYPFDELQFYILTLLIHSPKFQLPNPVKTLECFYPIFLNNTINQHFKLYLAVELIQNVFPKLPQAYIEKHHQLLFKYIYRHLPITVEISFVTDEAILRYILIAHLDILNRPQLLQLSQYVGLKFNLNLYENTHELKKEILRCAANFEKEVADIAEQKLSSIDGRCFLTH